MKTLLVDAYDSFIHIVEQYLQILGCDTEVRRPELNPAAIRDAGYDLVVLGPGPGHPVDSGHVELVRELAGVVPLFGICLGHQAIGVAFGAKTRRAGRLVHGKTSALDHDGSGVFAGLPTALAVTRYHSLIVDESTVPAELEVTARSREDGFVMAMRHRELAIESVQYHPESVTTEHGLQMLGNVVRAARGATVTPAASRRAA